jgi:exodeoxyribonuclease V alpha subunit
MTTVPDLDIYRRNGTISRDDIAATSVLVKLASSEAAPLSPLAWVAMCLALRTVRDGHTCVDLTNISDWAGDCDTSGGSAGDGFGAGPEWPTEPKPWIDALRGASALVGIPGERKPFILDGARLYLARALAEEESIAKAVLARAATATLKILLGGPGTGKTTTVARDLLELVSRLPEGVEGAQIALAAPTGKAAARMTEAVRSACEKASADAATIARIIPESARTIHKLLGYNPRRRERFTHHAGNPLSYDIVIIDEASMLSSSLMHSLLAAIHPGASLQLVGDPSQLASVDAGTVLGDLAEAAVSHPVLSRCVTKLDKVYRQESQSILRLAAAIRAGDAGAAFAALASGDASVEWVDPGEKKALSGIEQVVIAHADRLRGVARRGDPDAVLGVRSELQVLCGHRDGPMGVWGWNARVEKGLGVRPQDVWYKGRPVMVTRNNRAIGLSNGDVGVVIPKDGHLVAVFGIPRATHAVSVARLEDIATVHALTIHKSQGSEYDHAVVVLPEQTSRIATRELLYTGITRARKKVTLIGSKEVIRAAIKTPIRRATGLASRLGP